VSAIKTGGAAFPRPQAETSLGGNYEQDGMMLRDWFAGRAMQAALATSSADDEAGLLNLIPVVAKYSYLISDAMIAAREVKP